MAASIFDDKSKQPSASELDAALGEVAALLEDIERYLVEQFGEIVREFKFYSKAAQESGLPEEIKAAIEDAREYVEGRSIRFDVRTAEDVATVKQIIAIKMAN